MYIDDNNGSLFGRRYWVATIEDYCPDFNDMLLCAMATKCEPSAYETPWVEPGGKFRAWLSKPDPSEKKPRYYLGSYGLNCWVITPCWVSGDRRHLYWGIGPVEGASNLPVLLDSTWNYTEVQHESIGPRDYENAQPHRPLSPHCINRHDGFINSLFMDWTVRKVGLKELWTLKWHREFNTAGPWTKAGGVRPEDWPQWMRRFKDY
jgi:hypothetical protein